MRSNVRDLEGALRRVLANARFTGQPITLEFAKEALRDVLALQDKLVTVENIQKTVADYFKIRVADSIVEAAHPLDRATAPDRDGAREGADDAQPAGDRRRVSAGATTRPCCMRAGASRSCARRKRRVAED